MRGKRARSIRKIHNVKHVRLAAVHESVFPVPPRPPHELEKRTIPKEVR